MKRVINLVVLAANAIIERENKTNQRFVTHEQLRAYEQSVISILNSDQVDSFSLNKKYDFRQLVVNCPFFKQYQDSFNMEYLFLVKEKTISDLKKRFRSSLAPSLIKAFTDSGSLKALQIEEKQAFEIERKYLVTAFPYDLEGLKKHEISQTYLSFDPEISIRKEDDEYFLIEKGNGIIKRRISLESLSEEQFYLYLKNRITGIIYKTRYYVLIHNGLLMATVDFYHRLLEGLKIIEVEFNNMEMANSFKAPDWFGKEVTYNTAFRNSHLAEYCTMEQIINSSPPIK